MLPNDSHRHINCDLCNHVSWFKFNTESKCLSNMPQAIAASIYICRLPGWPVGIVLASPLVLLASLFLLVLLAFLCGLPYGLPSGSSVWLFCLSLPSGPSDLPSGWRRSVARSPKELPLTDPLCVTALQHGPQKKWLVQTLSAARP